MTLEELFKEYSDLDNPKVAGLCIYQYIKPSAEDTPRYYAKDLKVITTFDPIEEPVGAMIPSGFDEEEAKDIPEGAYLLSFPYQARYLIFANADEIDEHLIENGGKFKLPGYSYEEELLDESNI